MQHPAPSIFQNRPIKCSRPRSQQYPVHPLRFVFAKRGRRNAAFCRLNILQSLACGSLSTRNRMFSLVFNEVWRRGRHRTEELSAIITKRNNHSNASKTVLGGQYRKSFAFFAFKSAANDSPSRQWEARMRVGLSVTITIRRFLTNARLMSYHLRCGRRRLAIGMAGVVKQREPPIAAFSRLCSPIFE